MMKEENKTEKAKKGRRIMWAFIYIGVFIATAGINYTLRDEAHTEASVYSQSIEIKESMPVVIAEAEKLGYHINEMSIGGRSVQCYGRKRNYI